MDAIVFDSGDRQVRKRFTCSFFLARLTPMYKYTIVTCSGGQGNGSLRIIRNGSVFYNSARISELRGVVKLWPLKEAYGAESVCNLALFFGYE